MRIQIICFWFLQFPHIRIRVRRIWRPVNSLHLATIVVKRELEDLIFPVTAYLYKLKIRQNTLHQWHISRRLPEGTQGESQGRSQETGIRKVKQIPLLCWTLQWWTSNIQWTEGNPTRRRNHQVLDKLMNSHFHSAEYTSQLRFMHGEPNGPET